jgi:ATP-binding cassette subfamily B (MDR/TAP) protein 1
LKDLFHFADTRDVVLLVTGAVAAYVNGMVYPAFTIIFGDMSNSFIPTNNGDKIVDLAFKNAIYFLIVGGVAWVLSFIMFSCWMVSATRQTIKFRTNYFHCLLSQDIAWHDTMNPATISSKISNDAIQIQNGIGEKFGTLIMFLSMFINGIGVGFIYGWKMSLVLLAGLPFLGLGAVIMIWAVTTGSVRVNEINQEGGGLAEENISNIKTVKSLTAETFSFNRYKDVVLKSKVMIEKYGLLVSIGLGSTFFFMFMDYALAFYYGAKLVGDKTYNDNTGENYKVGDVMTIFFSILIGGFALGQASPSLKAIT